MAHIVDPDEAAHYKDMNTCNYSDILSKRVKTFIPLNTKIPHQSDKEPWSCCNGFT